MLTITLRDNREGDEARTRNFRLGRTALYHLSYSLLMEPSVGTDPTKSVYKTDIFPVKLRRHLMQSPCESNTIYVVCKTTAFPLSQRTICGSIRTRTQTSKSVVLRANPLHYRTISRARKDSNLHRRFWRPKFYQLNYARVLLRSESESN